MHNRWTACLAASVAFLVASAVILAGERRQQSATIPSASPSPDRATLDKYCVTCHNERGKTGGLVAIMVSAASIMLSWGFLNTLFALHYAHGYYGDYGEEHRGLDFPGGGEPGYWDFAYFAVVIGMTFQVSDVQVTSRELRRMVLVHGVIAFFFNVFIVAVSVNILAGRGL